MPRAALGTGFQPRIERTQSIDLGPVVAAIRDQIATQVKDDISSALIAEFRDALVAIVARTSSPQVSVMAPRVDVAPAQVSVEPAEVRVTVNPTIEPQIPGLHELTAQMIVTNQLLSTLITLLQRPVIKDIERDSYQNIKRVVETR